MVDSLVEAGHHVAVVDNLSTGRRENVNHRATLYEVDLRDAALSEVFERERPDVVDHHAAQVNVRRSTDDPVADANINLIGSINLLQCAVDHGVRQVVYISSGGAAYGEPEYLPVDEAHPIRPLSGYGASKYAVEQYLYVFSHVHDLDYTVLRYPNVYGPRQDPYGEGGVVAIFASRMLNGDTCTINGDGLQERDFVYVADCVRANELVLDSAGSGAGSGAGAGATYNLGWGRPTNINEVFDRLAAITGFSRPPVHGPAKAGETYRIFLDASHARDELGWQPTVALEEGLRLTVDHFRGLNGNP